MEDTAVQNSSLGSTPTQVSILDTCTWRENATFENCSHTDGVFEGLQSLRRYVNVCCEIFY